MTPIDFTCTSCGLTISRITAPKGYTSDKCFVCQWIDMNEHLTAAERELLRVKLRPPA